MHCVHAQVEELRAALRAKEAALQEAQRRVKQLEASAGKRGSSRALATAGGGGGGGGGGGENPKSGACVLL